MEGNWKLSCPHCGEQYIVGEDSHLITDNHVSSAFADYGGTIISASRSTPVPDLAQHSGMSEGYRKEVLRVVQRIKSDLASGIHRKWYCEKCRATNEYLENVEPLEFDWFMLLIIGGIFGFMLGAVGLIVGIASISGHGGLGAPIPNVFLGFLFGFAAVAIYLYVNSRQSISRKKVRGEPETAHLKALNTSDPSSPAYSTAVHFHNVSATKREIYFGEIGIASEACCWNCRNFTRNFDKTLWCVMHSVAAHPKDLCSHWEQRDIQPY